MRAGAFLLATVLLVVSCDSGTRATLAPPPGPASPGDLRARMVADVRARGVTDERVLAAMGEVERHRFVPADLAARAYEPNPLPIGEEQTISSPFIVGLMTQLLELTGDERVLEIGTGSGYQAAVLSRLVPVVHTIEIREGLASDARRRLAALGFDNVKVWCGDGWKGLPSEAPFDAILVTAAPAEIPAVLESELAPGGRMVVPVGGRHENQELILVRKGRDGTVTREPITPVWFVPMIRDD